MENSAERKMLIANFFESALKENFYQLLGKYDAEKVFDCLTRILEREEVKKYFQRAWAGDLAIDDALACSCLLGSPLVSIKTIDVPCFGTNELERRQ